MVITATNLPKERKRNTLQTLGERDYALPDVVGSKSKNVLGMVFGLMMLPILVPIVALLTLFMTFASENIRGRIISIIIPTAMKKVEKQTINQRKLLLQHASGRVLDIGGGEGPYLKLLKNKASHVVIIEPVQALHHKIRGNAIAAGFKDYQVTIFGDSLENYVASQNNHLFDWVILGNVLCEVTDTKSTLHHIHKVLRPGGHVYFSEHCGSPDGSMKRKMQNFVNPWWRTISGGCNCNRDSLDSIEQMDQWDTISWKLSGIQVWGGPFIMGLARKVEQGV